MRVFASSSLFATSGPPSAIVHPRRQLTRSLNSAVLLHAQKYNRPYATHNFSNPHHISSNQRTKHRAPSNAQTARVPARQGPQSLEKKSAAPKQSTAVEASSRETLLVKVDNVNPPAIARAPPLNVPPRQPGQAYWRYLFACGKAYVTFYKTGLKNIWVCYKAGRQIKRRIRSSRKGEESQSAVLTRAEFQLLRRNRADVVRLPIFGLLFALFGEWLPVLVVFITPVIPPSVRFPAQVDRVLRRVERWRDESFRGKIDSYVPSPQAVKEIDSVKKLDGKHILHMSRVLGLHGLVVDQLARAGWPAQVGSLLRGRVRRWTGYLKQDDDLIARDGGWKQLNEDEAVLACRERGIDTLKYSPAQCKDRLGLWYEGKFEGKTLEMLMSRPTAWK
ncbi:hypothetical protein K402DRAFT_373958 [Aulographum hederae CBS 113979]|uniref:Letm1 RBD domain-containing protein n=1 Tax=Aulographum hederae CBS 113979 TaxID=1176131 RepID=A0A6G1H4P5_9PEZI|nr:hypothetical protein K402DRAFT_373958 [Aulographum hederae CBS 113979]